MPTEKSPNILITGTPGVGKSHLCAKLAEKIGFKWHNVSALAKEKNFIEEFDEEYECPILDQDKLMDYLEPMMSEGGNIVEYHGCEFFPERWFKAVFVLRCDNTILYDRLAERDYNQKKLQSNVECEIFQTILEEARESYDKDIIFELKSETAKDVADNIKAIKKWLKDWRKS